MQLMHWMDHPKVVSLKYCLLFIRFVDVKESKKEKKNLVENKVKVVHIYFGPLYIVHFLGRSFSLCGLI